ncbi:MAG: phasin family protein [Dehalococcoidia bacterium]|nr:phasin family protein [Dehalococcoidia bacterium]
MKIKGGDAMVDLLRKTVLTGIGLAYMTKDKIEEMAKKISAESNLTEEESRRVAQDLLKQSEEAKRNLETRIDKVVKSALGKLDIPSRQDLQKLESRVEELEKLREKRGSSS